MWIWSHLEIHHTEAECKSEEKTTVFITGEVTVQTVPKSRTAFGISYTNTDMRRLTRGYVLRNASLGDFVVVRTCTNTNLDIKV